MKELIKKTREYLDYIEEHYENVQKAWKILQEKCKDMRFVYDDFVFHTIDSAIKNHDKSKLSHEEFIPYRKRFFPVTGELAVLSGFENAWENHKKENDHHWQKWVEMVENENSLEGHYADIFVVHMVADWMAMGMKFGDTAQSYYEKNKADIKIPEWADELLQDIFKRVI